MPVKTAVAVASDSPISEDDQARAGVYALLGALLVRPCDEGVRALVMSIAQDGSSNAGGLSWDGLKTEIAKANLQDLSHEYHDLFIGLGRGELLPYGSVYLTGFLQEKPLAELRTDLQRLGFETTEGTHEPEDHAGALCEVMSIMSGAPDEFSHETQKVFFEQHMGSWMTAFFDDLIKARESGFYRAVGEFGKAFLQIEKQYFEMEV
ncbi:MAG: molecular chaperone TorD family protein [Gammaproteobacteria bacterium]